VRQMSSSLLDKFIRQRRETASFARSFGRPSGTYSSSNRLPITAYPALKRGATLGRPSETKAGGPLKPKPGLDGPRA
jgi:hypothetical protein